MPWLKKIYTEVLNELSLSNKKSTVMLKIYWNLSKKALKKISGNKITVMVETMYEFIILWDTLISQLKKDNDGTCGLENISSYLDDSLNSEFAECIQEFIFNADTTYSICTEVLVRKGIINAFVQMDETYGQSVNIAKDMSASLSASRGVTPRKSPDLKKGKRPLPTSPQPTKKSLQNSPKSTRTSSKTAPKSAQTSSKTAPKSARTSSKTAPKSARTSSKTELKPDQSSSKKAKTTEGSKQKTVKT